MEKCRFRKVLQFLIGKLLSSTTLKIWVWIELKSLKNFPPRSRHRIFRLSRTETSRSIQSPASGSRRRASSRSITSTTTTSATATAAWKGKRSSTRMKSWEKRGRHRELKFEKLRNSKNYELKPNSTATKKVSTHKGFTYYKIGIMNHVANPIKLFFLR